MLKVLKYVKKYYFHLIVATAACFGVSVTTVMLTDFLKNLVDGNGLNSILQIAFILLTGLVSNYLVIYMTGYLGAGLLKDLRKDCVKGILNASPDAFSEYSRGEIMERVSEDVEALSGFIKEYFKDCLYVPVMVIVYAVYLFSINGYLAAWCLVPLLILVPINVKFMKPIKLMQFEYTWKLGLTNNNIQEVYDGAATVKAYNLHKRLQKKYYDALYSLFKISDSTDLKQYNLEPISRAVQELPVAIALIAGGIFVFNGDVTIGTLIAYISVLRSLVDPLSRCYQLVVRSQTAMVSIKRVFEVIDMPAERKGVGQDLGANCVNENIIEFENVYFKYKNDDSYTLEDVTFSVKKGEHVAFVGKSGSGKSTIIKLIASFLEKEKGSIKLYDTDYSFVSPSDIRSKIAYVSQDAILFPVSVTDNIRVGNSEADIDDINRVIKKTGCDSFKDMKLAERGSNLSGGQRQRISLARALIKDADIYLFDEPTSALDSETEQLICDTIAGLPKNKTVITVAHKLSTIEGYDKVYTVKEGHVV